MLGDNAAIGRKMLSKAVLFPVRLLYTLETGELGLNAAAASHFQESRGGTTATAKLVQAAYEDRAIQIRQVSAIKSTLVENGYELRPTSTKQANKQTSRTLLEGCF